LFLFSCLKNPSELGNKNDLIYYNCALAQKSILFCPKEQIILNRFEKLRHYISEIEGEFFSAKNFSRLLGFSPNLFGAIERGDTPPSKKFAARLWEKYNISREWFLTGEGQAPWEKEFVKHWQFAERIKQDIAAGRRPAGSEESYSILVAYAALKNGPEKNLIDFFIRAGREPAFRAYIYSGLERAVKIFDELEESRAKIAELEARSQAILPDLPARKVAEKDF